MKNHIKLFLIFFFTWSLNFQYCRWPCGIGNCNAQTGVSYEWANNIGNTGGDVSYSIDIDGSGNVYITGYFQGTVDFDPSAGTANLTAVGNYDIFLAKYNNNGNYSWAINIGKSSYAFVSRSVAVDASGNVYITGSFDGNPDFDPGPGTFYLNTAGFDDIFIAKFNTNGNFLWAKRMGGAGTDMGNAIIVDNFGNIITIGDFYLTSDFGDTSLISSGSADIFILKLDSSGNFIWARSMGAANGNPDNGRAIAVDASGDIFTTGSFFGGANFGPIYLNSNGNSDIFICKYDSSGNVLWAKSFGGNVDKGYSISVDELGNVLATGTFDGTVDFDPGVGIANLTSVGNPDIFFAKYDPNGYYLWAKRIGSTTFITNDYCYSIVGDNNSNVYLTGNFQDTADFDPNAGTAILTNPGAFFAKYDSFGNYLWAKSISSQSNCIGYSQTLDSQGNIYLTGQFQGTTDFDPSAGTVDITAVGNGDIFFAKYSQPPCSLTSTISKTDVTCPECSTGTVSVNVQGGVFPFIYQWSTGLTDTSVFNQYDLNNIPAGGYGVTVTDNSGCTTTAYIYVNQPSPYTMFVKTYGGTGDDQARSVVQAADGGYILTGYTTSFGGGQQDVYLVKTDAGGTVLWSAAYGDTSFEVGNCVRQTSDGGYIITGETNGAGSGGYDVFLMKTDSLGSEQWFQTYGGTLNERGFDVKQTSDGGYIIAGETYTYGNGQNELYLIKTGSTGAMQWAKTYGSGNYDEGRSVVEASDGGFTVAGSTRSYGGGSYDVYLIHADVNGTMLWTRTFGEFNGDYGYDMVKTPDNGYAIAGTTDNFGAGGSDVWLIKTDVNGTEQWTRTYGGTGIDEAYALGLTASNGFVITGYTNSFGAGGSDVYFILTDASGVEQWAWALGDTLDDAGYDIKQSSDGGFIITGLTLNNTSGSYDMLLMKTDQNGSMQCNSTWVSSTTTLNPPDSLSSGGLVTVGGIQLSGVPGSNPVPATVDNTACIFQCNISIAITKTDVTCNGYNDGSATATATNGTPPYEYFWSNGADTSSINLLPSSVYSVTVSDLTGCTATASVTIDVAKAGNWTQKADFGGTARSSAVAFSIGNKGYIGTGTDDVINYRDFWEWDLATNTWTQKADFGGTARLQAVGFSIGTKGYIGTGWNDTTAYRDFWEWDQSTNTWTPKADFGGTARWVATGFSIGAKGYIGTGWDGTNKQDFWEYDTAANTWTPKADFGGTPRRAAVGFSIGTKGYIGTGLDDATDYRDFWEWNQSTNTWMQKADFGGAARRQSVGFSNPQSGKGYIGTGWDGAIPYQDFWEWDQSTNTWTRKADFGGGIVWAAAGFSLGEKGYIGTGANPVSKRDFWEFDADTTYSLSIVKTNVLCYGDSNGSVTANPSGGFTPYTYLWNDSVQANSRSSLAAGTYTVTVTDANSCTLTASATITQPAALTDTSAYTVNPGCFGDTLGLIDYTVTGGTPPYSFLWSTGDTTQMIYNLGSDPYSVTLTDSNNCTVSNTFTITTPPVLDITTFGPTFISCNGESDGALNPVYTGGTPPYTYLWNDSVQTNGRSSLPAGTYTVTVTDANGCTMWDFMTLTEPPFVPTYTDTITMLLHDGINCIDYPIVKIGSQWWMKENVNNVHYSDGASLGNGTGVGSIAGDYTTKYYFNYNDTAAYSNTYGKLYTWAGAMNGAAGSDSIPSGVQGVCPTGWHLPGDAEWKQLEMGLGMDQANADGVTWRGIDEGAKIKDSIAWDGTNTSGFTALPSGYRHYFDSAFWYLGSYAEFWSAADDSGTDAWSRTLTSGSGQVSRNLYDKSYGFSVRCVMDVFSPPLVVSITNVTNVLCNGDSTGAATATATGGTPPYTYLWSNGETQSAIYNLQFAIYNVTVTDAGSNTAVDSVTITEPTALGITTFNPTFISCNGGSDGGLSPDYSGGTPPYVYLWSNGDTTAAITNLSAGTFAFTITDANGCTFNDYMVLPEPPVNIDSVSSAICSGDSIFLSGSWQSAGGNYYDTLVSMNGCDSVIATTLTVNSTYTTPATAALCSGDSIFLGGSWQSVAGTYYDTLASVNGCDSVITTMLTVNAVYSVNNPQTICNGDSYSINGNTYTIAGNYEDTLASVNGCDSVITTMLTVNAVYSVNNPQTICNGDSYSINGNTYTIAGNYEDTLTSVNGCDSVITTMLTVTTINISIPFTTPSCYGSSNGSVAVSASGGSAPYNYVWSSGDSDSLLAAIGSGSYSVTVTDANACTGSDSISLTEPALITVTANATNVSTCGGSNGTITITAAGGSGALQYSMDGGITFQSPNIFSGLTAGTYTIIVKDAANCAKQTIATVGAYAGTITLAMNATLVSCNGGNDGTAMVTAAGGTAPYTFVWNNGESQFAIYNLQSAIYNVTVIDSVGCIASSSVTVTEPLPMVVSFASITIPTCGLNDGAATADVTGGIPPYVFVWTNNDTLAAADGLGAGIHSVIVTDDNGCIAYGTLSLSSSNGPSISFTKTDNTCSGLQNGSINISVTGGYPPYSIEWSDGDTAQNRSGLGAGIYEVVVTASDSCIATATIEITAPGELAVAVTKNDASCGIPDATTTATATGGTPSYSYQWSTGSNQPSVNGLMAGVYFVAVSDANGCLKTKTVAINDIGGPVVEVVSMSNTGCGTMTSGAIDIGVTGGSGGYSYLWSDSSTTQNVSGLPEGEYFVTVTDSAGCVSVEHVLIETTMPAAEPICIVTVDSATKRNLIVWDKTLAPPDIEEFRIYKEGTAAGVYNFIGSVSYGSSSEFLDMAANPLQRSWRYKIKTVDTCGNESDFSEVHKTMHLAVNLGIGNKINLIWDPYEGFSYSTFVIYRGTNPNQIDSLDAIPSTLHSYTDLNPPQTPKLYYIVSAVHPSGCTVLQKVKKYNASKSNTSSMEMPIGIEELRISECQNCACLPAGRDCIRISPNPHNHDVTVSYNLTEDQTVSLEIFDMRGIKLQTRAVNENQLAGVHSYRIIFDEPGVYFIRLTRRDGTEVRRLVKVR